MPEHATNEAFAMMTPTPNDSGRDPQSPEHTPNDEAAALSPNLTYTNQDSALVKLPGELKNRILELAMPTNTTIALRQGSRTILPSPPPVLAVYRQLRADALAVYYASSVFLITDVMFQSKALERFAAERGPAAHHIRRFRVSHEVKTILLTGTHRLSRHIVEGTFDDRGDLRPGMIEYPVDYNVTFSLAIKGGKIEISGCKTRRARPALSEGGEERNLCDCTLRRMAQEYGSDSTKQDMSLLDMLVEYVGLVSDHNELVRTHRQCAVGSAAEFGVRRCLKCSKVMAI